MTPRLCGGLFDAIGQLGPEKEVCVVASYVEVRIHVETRALRHCSCVAVRVCCRCVLLRLAVRAASNIYGSRAAMSPRGCTMPGRC